jgi:SAM-dependent methyltransferase
MAESPFQDLTAIYDALVDWPKRLAHEEPFYRRLFERIGARRVADVACGTGRHAAMFHSWGLCVEGSDLDPNMVELARAKFGEPEGLRFVVREFDQPIRATEPFDVALCVGNSLALAPDAATTARAIHEMLAAVRDGGAVVAHVLNLWRLPDGPCVWQKCLRASLAQRDVLITKGVHRSGARGYVDLLVAPVDAPEQVQSESVPLLGIEASELSRMAAEAGASDVQLYGGYREEPYERIESTDLILVARRGHGP